MDRAAFISVVRRALRDVPEPFREHLKQIDIIVKRRPTPDDLRDAELHPGETMYGFYRGIPLTLRGASDSMVLPDIIEIYQEPLEEDFPDIAELEEEIRVTVLHELAHFFGIDDDRLEELGLG